MDRKGLSKQEKLAGALGTGINVRGAWKCTAVVGVVVVLLRKRRKRRRALGVVQKLRGDTFLTVGFASHKMSDKTIQDKTRASETSGKV